MGREKLMNKSTKELVKLLRIRGGTPIGNVLRFSDDKRNICLEAADLIERLDKENREMKYGIKDIFIFQ
jgi:hypothetical protein